MLITARIVENPIRFANFSYYSTEIQVNFLHMRNYFARAIVFADGKVGKSVFEIYRQGDYVIIEGECLVVEDAQQNSILIVYVINVHPAHLIMKD